MTLHESIDLKSLGILNPLITDYLAHKPSLQRLFTHAPQQESLNAAIHAKQAFSNRNALVQALQSQYKNLTLSSATKANLESLADEHTFTICTAHQLCLFTGPSYFIYKILSAVKLSKMLKEEYPKNNFVPVYWMGSEDHDFEEIRAAHVYGKSITWQNDESGAVGKHSLAGIKESIAELSELLGQQAKAQKFIHKLESFFSGNITYGQAFQAWIMDLFSDFGLIVLDQDDTTLKRCFSSIMKDEILNSSVQASLKSNEDFLATNYHVQASSRAINLFYLKDGIRARIEKEGEEYTVVNTDIRFSRDSILNELNEHPERFSPNVFLRPLYQESVLPNIAFVGGPGEVAYWLQLKDVFDYHQVKQPLILLRDMAVVMSQNHLAKLEDWNISIEDLFTHYDEIAKEFVANESSNDLSLSDQTEAIKKVFEDIKTKALEIDKNMGRSVEAEQQKVFNSISNLENKLIRAEKRNFEQQLKQLENIQSKLLPNDTLQERHDNFIPLYLKHQESYFEDLLQSFNPLQQTLKVFKS